MQNKKGNPKDLIGALSSTNWKQASEQLEHLSFSDINFSISLSENIKYPNPAFYAAAQAGARGADGALEFLEALIDKMKLKDIKFKDENGLTLEKILKERHGNRRISDEDFNKLNEKIKEIEDREARLHKSLGILLKKYVQQSSKFSMEGRAKENFLAEIKSAFPEVIPLVERKDLIAALTSASFKEKLKSIAFSEDVYNKFVEQFLNLAIQPKYEKMSAQSILTDINRIAARTNIPLEVKNLISNEVQTFLTSKIPLNEESNKILEAASDAFESYKKYRNTEGNALTRILNRFVDAILSAFGKSTKSDEFTSNIESAASPEVLKKSEQRQVDNTAKSAIERLESKAQNAKKGNLIE